MKRDDFIGLSKAEQTRELDELEEKIELVRAAYARYFNGVDDRVPGQEHTRVKNEVRRMINRRFRGTDLKFRFNGLRSRLISYEQYWNRTLNQIEKGTYKRLLAVSRARDRKISRGQGADLPAITGSSFELGGSATEVGGGPVDMDALAAEAAAAVDAVQRQPAAEPSARGARPRASSSRRPKAVRARASAPAPQLPDGIDAKQARQIFKQFVQAKRALGQQTEGLTYGKLVKKLARDVPKLQARAGDRAVRLEVATVNGKVKLRAKGE